MVPAIDHRTPLRQVLANRYLELISRKVVLDDPLFDTPLGEALAGREAFVEALIRLPHAGVKTAETIRYVFQQEAERLLAQAPDDPADPARLPAELARNLRHWLSIDDKAHATFNSVGGAFLTGGMDSNDRHPFWVLSNITGRNAFYLPNTIPDIFKTADVWKAERGAGGVSAGYAANLKKVMEVAAGSELSIRFVIDEAVWRSLVERTGKYRGLTEAQVAQQVAVMKSVAALLGERVSFDTTDFATAGVSNCLAVEGEFVSSYVFGGYYISRDPRLVRHVFRALDRAPRAPILA